MKDNYLALLPLEPMSIRQNKVESLIKREMAQFFQLEGKPLVNGVMVTLTIVRISSDLSEAKIYLSLFPSEKHEEVLARINTSAHEIRHNLAQKLRHSLRKIPNFKFFLDDSLDYASRIDELLK